MTRDVLSEAARALKVESEQLPGSAKFTRARVMASLHQSQLRRRTRLAFILPLAASFAAATAFGTLGGRGPELLRSVGRALGFQVDTPSSVPAPRTPEPRRLRSQPAEPASNGETLKAEIPVPEAPPDVPADSEHAAPASRALLDAKSTAAVERDPAHDLYRAAHQAHFVDRDCTRALEAWSNYLALAPGGRFAPEARYNHALCLVRLDQRDAARVALSRFARGEHGGYRQREAQALLDALER